MRRWRRDIATDEFTFTYPEPISPFFHIRFREVFSYDDVFFPAGIPLTARREILLDTKEVGKHIIEDFFALYLTRQGNGTHVIADHEYGLSRGDVYVHPAGIEHNYRNVVHMEQDTFYFQAGVFTKLELAGLRRMTGFWRLLTPDPGGKVMTSRDYRLHLTPERMVEVEGLVDSFWTMVNAHDPISSMLARNYFVCLIGTLARWYGQGIAPSGEATAHSADIASILEYCEQNSAQELRVPDLASRMFMSVDHFASTFLREVGFTPAAYVRRLRMERAHGLLRTTQLPIEEIGTKVGYRSAAQFARAFRKAFGTSPSTVRKRRKF